MVVPSAYSISAPTRLLHRRSESLTSIFGLVLVGPPFGSLDERAQTMLPGGRADGWVLGSSPAAILVTLSSVSIEIGVALAGAETGNRSGPAFQPFSRNDFLRSRLPAKPYLSI